MSSDSTEDQGPGPGGGVQVHRPRWSPTLSVIPVGKALHSSQLQSSLKIKAVKLKWDKQSKELPCTQGSPCPTTNPRDDPANWLSHPSRSKEQGSELPPPGDTHCHAGRGCEHEGTLTRLPLTATPPSRGPSPCFPGEDAGTERSCTTTTSHSRAVTSDHGSRPPSNSAPNHPARIGRS